MGRAAVVVLSMLAGCLQPGSLQCADGRTCPSSTTCDDTNHLCLQAGQAEACQNLVDGASCTFGGQVGVCQNSVCVPSACGNGVIDPGEVCDDGNTAGGDGCSADCKKIEVCGDGVLDVGEQCDDGNTNPADGCDQCTQTTWRATPVIGGTANAVSVGLGSPSAIAVDRRGNLYVADTNSNRVRRIDTTGVVTFVAGTGASGFSGDGGAATSAQLFTPNGLAVDGLGNLYIADTENNRIRRVDTAGIITTIAGSGTCTGGSCVSGFAGDSGAATSARLDFPFGVTVDGLGNLYIADTFNNRIRRVDTTGIITTVAGTGPTGPGGGYGGDGAPATGAQLNLPVGIAVDDLGNLYIADAFNVRIRKVDVAGVITTLAGTGASGFSGDLGPATSAQLGRPTGIALDSSANLYIADNSNARIREIDATTGVIATVAGSGTIGFSGDGGQATAAELAAPSGVAVDRLGDFYIVDSSNRRVRRVATTGVIATVAGNGSIDDGGQATSAPLSLPSGVRVDSVGTVYIVDTENHRIRRVDAAGAITTVAGNGTAGYGGDNGAAIDAQLDFPSDVVVDGLGNLYIADTSNARIRKVDPSNTITTVAGTGIPGFSGDGGAATGAQLGGGTAARLEAGDNPATVSLLALAIDNTGNLYIADPINQRVRRVDHVTGLISTIAGSGSCTPSCTGGFSGDNGPATGAQLDSPNGVAVDNLGNIYISDTNNHRIRRVDAITRVITTVAGSGSCAPSCIGGFGGDGGAAASAQLFWPHGVSLDSLGNLYIADTQNDRIRRIDSAGAITTVAGSSPLGDGDVGDGSAATSAQLDRPYGVAVDQFGKLYIADIESQVIRRVAAGLIMTIAGLVDPEGMGPLAQARFADPRALVLAPFTLVAGGASGTVQAARPTRLDVVIGRTDQLLATGMLARFRDSHFGTISGIAYDAVEHLLYLTEFSVGDPTAAVPPSSRVHVVTIVDPADANTWTIAPLANAAGTAGFLDGPAQAAMFRDPTGLYLDATAHQLYVADTGNHVIRAIDLSNGVASATVRTVAGTPATRGFFGDGDDAAKALLFKPQALTKCASGDLFIADTGNNRVRRVAAGTNVISTVLGDGSVSSSGDGSPASIFPVNAPLGLACDATGNLYASSTTTVREVSANASGVVDGTGIVQTIYGASPRDAFPASVTSCLTGLAIVDATNLQVVDSCTGLLVNLERVAK